METLERREQIIKILEQSGVPVSGTELAKRLSVSRQVIVQDIALLRAVNKNILSTNKGYILYHTSVPARARRSVRVKHHADQTREELYCVVDLGGKMLDVVVEHEIYGQIMVDLIISNRRDADEFVNKVEHYKTRPLNALTDGVHYHTIEADSEEILDEIENALKDKRILD